MTFDSYNNNHLIPRITAGINVVDDSAKRYSSIGRTPVLLRNHGVGVEEPVPWQTTYKNSFSR